MMKRLVCYSLLLACGVVSATAQEVLTIEQCRALALQHNKSLSAARLQTRSLQSTVKQYRANYLPNITASGTGLYSTADGNFGISGGNLPVLAPNAAGQLVPNGNVAYFPGIDLNYKVGAGYMAGVQVEQPLFTGGKITAGYRMAQLGHEMSVLNETLTASEVILNTENAYALLVKAQEMKTVALRYRELLTELQRNVQSAYKHGMKPKNDVLKVQVKMNESELNIQKADNAIRLAQMNLCHYIGQPLTTQIQTDTVLPRIPAFTESDLLSETTQRPEYAVVQKQVEMAEQKVKLERSALLPQIGVSGGYNYLYGGKLNDARLFHKGNFSVLLNVSIPIYHFGERTHKVKAAKIQLEQARVQQADAQERMNLELMQALNEWRESELEYALAERSLEQATENVRVSTKQYEAGMELLSDHLEAQTLWQQAYQTQVETRYRRYISYIAYLKAKGSL